MGIGGQGFNEAIGTAFFTFFTLFCMGQAHTTILARNIRAHLEWMIRSWALMLLASCLSNPTQEPMAS